MNTSADDIPLIAGSTLSIDQLLLQKRFMALTEKMAAINCPLPDQFHLYYHVTLAWYEDGSTASVKPFLTKEAAKQDQGEDDEDCDQHSRHDTKIRHLFIDANSKPKTYSFNGEFEDIPPPANNHQIDFSISEYQYPDLEKE